MKTTFQRMAKGLSENASAGGTAICFALVSTVLASCSLIATNFNTAGESLSTNSCGTGTWTDGMTANYSTAKNSLGKSSQQASQQVNSNTLSNSTQNTAEGSNENLEQLAATPALTVLDRHWHMAEALKVALDRKAQLANVQ